MSPIIIKGIQLLLSLSLLVVLHELGHFIPAKLFKTRVEKFYLFFDVKFALFKKKIGGTSCFFYLSTTHLCKQADTGTKMIHLGKNTRSTIISKGISAGRSQNSYRGLVQVHSKATNARNFSQCDSLLMGDQCGAHTFPYIEVKNNSAQIEHEATTSKIGEDQIFYCNQRGIDTEKAIALIVNGFSKEVLNKLPMEFAVEAQKLLEISLEGSVG